MSIKKVSTTILALVMATSVMAGCSGSGSSSTGSASEGSSSADTIKQEKVKLKLLEHANEGTNQGMKALNADFSAKFPHITVETQIIGTAEYAQAQQTALAANNVDIFEFSVFNSENPEYTKGLDKSGAVQYVENGDILDLTNEEFMNNWPDNTKADALTMEGKVYTVPTGKAAINGVFYNKKIFSENGLSVPKTWDEFMGICQTLQDNGITPLTAGGKDVWPVAMLFNALVSSFDDPAVLAKDFWTGDRKFNDEKTLQIFKNMEKFSSYFEQGVMSIDYAAVIGRFLAGKAAMLPDGSWQSANIELADPNFDYGYFVYPSIDGSKEMQMEGKYDICYAGSAKSKNTDAILTWLDFYSQKDNYQKFITASGLIPAMDVTVDTKFMKEAGEYNQNFGLGFELVNRNPKGVGQYAGFQMTQLKSLGGKIATVEELADLAQSDWDKAIKAAK